MSVIVFSGKGGTGKTTLSALALKYFVENGKLSLALDLDPDAHLFKALGIKISKTIGQVIDIVHKEKNLELEPRKPPEMADIDYFYNQVMNNVLIEGDKLDLLTLGKPTSGIDCYCPAFYWADHTIDRIVKNYGKIYDNLVIDCDPGTEIFPRKILDTIAHECGIDLVFVVLDASNMSLDTAQEIAREVEGRGWKGVRVLGVLNRVDPPGLRNALKDAAAGRGIDIVGFIPQDDKIVEKNLKGESLVDVVDARAYDSMREILDRVI